MDISKKYHPDGFEDYVNQRTAKELAKGLIESGEPGSPLLLYGPFGVGKTTFARIIAQEMLSNPETNYKEIDCSRLGNEVIEAAEEKLDSKRLRKISEYPVVDKFKVVLMDELHNVTSKTQEKLRKVIERREEEHQIIIASNSFDGIEPAIRSRCIPVQFESLSDSHVRGKLQDIVKEESLDISEGEIERIVENVDGDIRQALKRLEGVANASS